MKLLLINPLDKNTSAFSNHFPPLGLGYIAALTPPEWEIEFIDENFERAFPLKADLVAISAMTIQINRVYEICTTYKKLGVPVIVGGIHASMLPQEVLGYSTSVVVGEAEELWEKILEDFMNGRLKRIYKNGSYPSLQNMVIPRRDLFSKKYLFDAVQTSRGCPFNCDFCSVPSFNGKEYRLRPVDEIIEELKTTKKKCVFFVDDNIVGCGQESEDRAAMLFEGMIRSGIKKHWVSQSSINVTRNNNLLRLMKKSGCLGLLLGFESIDKKNLQKCGKFQNVSRDEMPEKAYQDVINKLHKYGIAVNGYFCYGYEDTPESILKSHRFIIKSGIDIVNTPITIPSPGTSLYKKLYNEIEFKNYPKDWDKYLGRLVYCPGKTSKKEFYKAYIISANRINSVKEMLKRICNSLMWSRSFVHTFFILLFNLGFRKLRKKGLSFLLKEDEHFRKAYNEVKNKPMDSHDKI